MVLNSFMSVEHTVPGILSLLQSEYVCEKGVNMYVN